MSESDEFVILATSESCEYIDWGSRTAQVMSLCSRESECVLGFFFMIIGCYGAGVFVKRYTDCLQFQIFIKLFLFTVLKKNIQPVDFICISMHNSVMQERDKVKNTQINVRMDSYLAERLKKFADRAMTTPSQVVRKAVHDYVEKWAKHQKG